MKSLRRIRINVIDQVTAEDSVTALQKNHRVMFPGMVDSAGSQSEHLLSAYGSFVHFLSGVYNNLQME